MAYTTINGKLVKINKTFKKDPNIKDFSSLVSKGGMINLKFAHLTPEQVHIDTDTHYKATYNDDYGTYDFEIHKTDKGYTVISDGNVCSQDNPDRDHIIWNYENQVASCMPKVLEAA